MGVGIQQNYGFGLSDQNYVDGIAQGQNWSTQVVTAFAGGGQAGATQINPAAAVVAIGTVVTAGDSVGLPFAVPGQSIDIANNTVTSANIFGKVAINKLTGVVDQINLSAGSNAYAIATGVAVRFTCAQAGFWNANKSA